MENQFCNEDGSLKVVYLSLKAWTELMESCKALKERVEEIRNLIKEFEKEFAKEVHSKGDN